MDNQTSSNALDFRDPGPMDATLLDIPGFVNDLKAHTLASGFSPNETLAFSGALAMLAHLSGRTYRDTHGTRTNLYLIALGETGIGKDEPRRANRKLAELCGGVGTIADAMASGKGLEENIAKHPSLLLQADEVETLINATRGTNKNAQNLSERLRRLFTASSGAYSLRAKAANGEGALVNSPHLTLFGTGTPDEFYDALDQHAVRNGLFGRCLVLKAEDEYRANRPSERPMPAELVKTATFLSEMERKIDASGVIEPIVATETPEAAARLNAAAVANMDLRKRLTEANLSSARALVVRVNEKVAKLALLHAISANPAAPIITAEGVAWAIKFVTHVTKEMLYESQFHVAEGKFDALVKRFIALLAKNGGTMDRRTLMRNLHVDHGTFKRITLTLHMCDMIIEEQESYRKVHFTLKNAA